MKKPKPLPFAKPKRKKRSLSAPKIQYIFNRWIRQRDSKDGFFWCISCGQFLPTSSMNAGHYIPRGRATALRFNEDNVNGECESCNAFDKFHLIGYRKNLINKIGLEKVLWLEEHSHDLKKWKSGELQEIKQKYSERITP